MKKNWLYCKYLARHKWFVFVAGLKFKVPIWRLLIHDWSKLRPVEWVPYREYFYGERTPAVEEAFTIAWLSHIHRNPHHWNNWVFIDEDGTQCIQIPDTYVREMLADWYGAGRAIYGAWRAPEWYEKNKTTMMLHEDTRAAVEVYLRSIKVRP